MSFLRRLFAGGDDAAAAAKPTASPAGPVPVRDPEATLTEHLATLVARPKLEFLIVEYDAARKLYVQFAADDATHGLHAESVGDRYLEPRDHLGDAQRAQLEGLGWSESIESGNWDQTWPSGTDPAAVAGVCVKTMDVYGMAPLPEWTITFGG